jgi:hypothetical protein
MQKLLNKYIAPTFFTLGVSLFHVLMSLELEQEVKNIYYFFLTPAALLLLILFFQNLKIKISRISSSGVGIVIFLVSVTQTIILFPNSYIAYFYKLLIFVLFFIIQIFDDILQKDKRFNLINIFPLLLMYREFWKPEHPFSLWVVFSFLNIITIVKPLFSESLSLSQLELHASEKISHLFLTILIIFELTKSF